MWGESLHDGLRCPCDDREVGSRSDFRRAPVAFPVFDGIEAESEGLGKPRLGHMQVLPDALDVNRIGNVDLKALAITGEVNFDLVEAAHQFVECAGHDLSPVRVDNVIRTLLKLVAFPFGKVGFLVVREDSNEEDGKAFVPVDVDNTRSTALAPIANPDPDLAKAASLSHQVAALRIGRDHGDDLRHLGLAEELSSEREVRGSLDDRLHIANVCHWTPSVKGSVHIES
jgi:hypothetical protein